RGHPPLQRIDYRVENLEGGEPAIVRLDDSPGRIIGVGFCQHMFGRSQKFAVLRVLTQIFLGYSPNRCRVRLEGGEPSLLLAFGDVEEEFNDYDTLIAQ